MENKTKLDSHSICKPESGLYPQPQWLPPVCRGQEPKYKSINEPEKGEDLSYGNVTSQSHDGTQRKQELLLSHCFLTQRAGHRLHSPHTSWGLKSVLPLGLQSVPQPCVSRCRFLGLSGPVSLFPGLPFCNEVRIPGLKSGREWSAAVHFLSAWAYPAKDRPGT